jgi:hypothetical protein
MPQRSDIMRYKAGDCFEVTLDISDVPDATFQSATFFRGGSQTDWPLAETEDFGRCEFRSAPDLLALHLTPSLPDGYEDDLTLPVEEILGQLNIKLGFKDPKSGENRDCVIELRVIPCAVSACDTCEANEHEI